MAIRTLLAICLFSLLPCGYAHAEEAGGVVVTIKPLHSLVAGVMEGTGTPELLVKGTVSPHEFQLKPSQMKVLQSAGLVFYIDDSFESFLSGAFETLPAQVRKAAAAQKAGLTVLTVRQGGAWEAHQHATSDPAGVAHDHDDMHVWLDPENAEKIVKFITRELSAVYPENQNLYKANARSLVERLHALDTKLKQELAGLGDTPFVVFHDAYQYFERRYALSAVGSITLDPDESPSPGRIREVREKISQTHAACVFREPYFSDRLVNTVIEGSQARSGVLDPEATTLEPGKDAYFTLMENLATDLRRCLKP